MISGADALQANVCSQAIEAQQQSFLQSSRVKTRIAGSRLKVVGEMHAQIGFFEDVQQADHRPALADLGLQTRQMHWFGLGGER